MAKFNPIKLSVDGKKRGYIFKCPGCNMNHYIQTNKAYSPCWNFNGDVNRPTVTPSIRVQSQFGICHMFVTDGNIKFLDDCWHELAGKTITIPEWD